MDQPEARIRVVVADRHPLLRAALGFLVASSPRLELAGTTGDGAGALTLAQRDSPAVTVLDLGLAGPGAALVRAVRSLHAPPRILLLAEPGAGRPVLDALAAGADGCLARTDAPPAFLAAILRVARGLPVLSPAVGATLVPYIHAQAAERRLSEDDERLLRWMADGLPADAMARRLGLAPAALRGRIDRVYGLLGVCDRGAAVATAMRRHLIA